MPGEVVVLDASNGKELARLQTERAMRNVLFVDGGDALDLSELRTNLREEPDKLLLYWDWPRDEAKSLVKDNPVSYLAMAPGSTGFATAEGNRNPDNTTETPVGKLQSEFGVASTAPADPNAPQLLALRAFLLK